MSKRKTLHKSNNKVISGVAAGVAEYFDVDVTLMRLLFLAIIIFTGLFPGLLFYVVAAIIMPAQNEV